MIDLEDIEDPLDGNSQLSSIQEEGTDDPTANSSDAEDESSQSSESPGITLTPDCKNSANPFKYPQSRAKNSSSAFKNPQSRTKETSSKGETSKINNEKEDDGFFSGIDVEDMDLS